MQITFENWKRKSGADIVLVLARRQRHGGRPAGGNNANLNRRSAEFHFAYQKRSRARDRGGTPTRAHRFFDVPTLGELGFPNLAPVYFGFVAPAGTSKEIIQILHDEIAVIGNEPAFRQKRLIEIGIVPSSTPRRSSRNTSSCSARTAASSLRNRGSSRDRQRSANGGRRSARKLLRSAFCNDRFEILACARPSPSPARLSSSTNARRSRVNAACPFGSSVANALNIGP